MALVRNTNCAVPECKVPQALLSHLKQHRFPDPKQEARRAAYLRFCQLDSDPGGHLIICSAHFPDEAYQLSGRVLGRDRKNWKLNRDAVPSLFPPPGYVPPEELSIPATEEDPDPIIEEEEEVIVNELAVPSLQCRLCLDMVDSDDPRSVHLFHSTAKGGTSLFAELLTVFKLRMESSPLWPSIACHKCVDFMDQIRRFKEQILTSHRILYKEIVQEARNDEEEEMETEIQQEDLPEEVKRIINEVACAEAGSGTQEAAIKCNPRRDLEREEELEKQMRDYKLLYCGECSAEEFATLEDLHCHQQTEHKLAVGYIWCCKGKFKIFKGAYDHMEYHQDQELFKCSDCDKAYMSGNLLQQHKSHNHRTKYPCRTCGKILPSRPRLRTHEATHLPIEQRPRKCSYCPKGFTNAAGLKRHVERMHEIEERHICDVCGRKFSNAGTLWQHRQNHKRVKSPRSLATPDVSLGGMELLKCIYCSAEVQRREMSSHTRKIHNRAFMECVWCRIQFKSCGQFKEHKDRHNNVVFNCEFCDKICNNAQGRYCHMRSHHLEEFLQRKLSRRKVPRPAE